MNNSVALHDEGKRQDKVTAANEMQPKTPFDRAYLLQLARDATPAPTGEWAAVKAQFVKQDPKARKKAVAALEKHFKKFKPNYFRQT